MSAPSSTARAGRQGGIEAVRALGALAVVLIHVGPFRGAEWEGTPAGLAGAFLNQLCRFAVPFFFLATGYFFGRKLGSSAPPWPLWRKQAGRLAVLFAFWSAAYLLVPAVLRGLHHRSLDAFGAFMTEKLGWALSHPATSLLQGSAEHLWFLPALALGVAALALVHALRVPPLAMAVLAGGSYLVALLGGSYSPSPLGLDLGWNGHAVYRPGGLEVHPGPPPEIVLSGPRVGVDYARPADRDVPWRLADGESTWVSYRSRLK